MNVIEVTHYDGGGNCNVYYDKMDNGKHFLLSQGNLSILDADWAETLTEEFFDETEGDTLDWGKEHTLERYEYPIAEQKEKHPEQIVRQAFEILKKKEPKAPWNWDEYCLDEIGIEY